MIALIDGDMLMLASDDFVDIQVSDAIFIPIKDLRKILCLNFRRTHGVCTDDLCKNCERIMEWTKDV